MTQLAHGCPKNESLKRLVGKVAVITGGARGIGAATAVLFAEHGAYVVIADILDELGTTLAEKIGGRFVHCDVSKEQDIESAVQLAVNWKGKLDIMFNNAGIPGHAGSILNMKMETVEDVLAINLKGMVSGIKHGARAMIKGNEGAGGSIICSSSSAALMGGLGSHPYSLSKEAIIGLARSTACELGEYGIRVNCVSPHGVPTEMLVDGFKKYWGNKITPGKVSQVVGETGSLLKGRGATVEDVAHAALFLASDDAGFITGHNLVIDGGFTSGVSSMSFIYHDY